MLPRYTPLPLEERPQAVLQWIKICSFFSFYKYRFMDGQGFWMCRYCGLFLQIMKQPDSGFHHEFSTSWCHTGVDGFVAALKKCFFGRHIGNMAVGQFNHQGIGERGCLLDCHAK